MNQSCQENLLEGGKSVQIVNFCSFEARDLSYLYLQRSSPESVFAIRNIDAVKNGVYWLQLSLAPGGGGVFVDDGSWMMGRGC